MSVGDVKNAPAAPAGSPQPAQRKTGAPAPAKHPAAPPPVSPGNWQNDIRELQAATNNYADKAKDADKPQKNGTEHRKAELAKKEAKARLLTAENKVREDFKKELAANLPSEVGAGYLDSARKIVADTIYRRNLPPVPIVNDHGEVVHSNVVIVNRHNKVVNEDPNAVLEISGQALADVEDGIPPEKRAMGLTQTIEEHTPKNDFGESYIIVRLKDLSQVYRNPNTSSLASPEHGKLIQEALRKDPTAREFIDDAVRFCFSDGAAFKIPPTDIRYVKSVLENVENILSNPQIDSDIKRDFRDALKSYVDQHQLPKKLSEEIINSITIFDYTGVPF